MDAHTIEQSINVPYFKSLVHHPEQYQIEMRDMLGYNQDGTINMTGSLAQMYYGCAYIWLNGQDEFDKAIRLYKEVAEMAPYCFERYILHPMIAAIEWKYNGFNLERYKEIFCTLTQEELADIACIDNPERLQAYPYASLVELDKKFATCYAHYSQENISST